MHNRYYAPRLAHFLTPDFRRPSILDPTTFKEPYAYATGNPISYWDPNGLEVTVSGEQLEKVYELFGKENVEVRKNTFWFSSDTYTVTNVSERGVIHYFLYALLNEVTKQKYLTTITAFLTPFWEYEGLEFKEKKWIGQKFEGRAVSSFDSTFDFHNPFVIVDPDPLLKKFDSRLVHIDTYKIDGMFEVPVKRLRESPIAFRTTWENNLLEMAPIILSIIDVLPGDEPAAISSFRALRRRSTKPLASLGSRGVPPLHKLPEVLKKEKIVELLKGHTLQANKIANGLETNKLGLNILGDDLLERLYKMVGGEGEVEAFALGEQIYVRRSSQTIISDIVHEGTHGLDFLSLKWGEMNEISKEKRAFFYERQFQISSQGFVEFETVDEMLDFIYENY